MSFHNAVSYTHLFVAADKDTINWLRHNSRSYIFSASNTPAATAAARAALHILKSEPERRENLWKITNYALDCSVRPVLKSVILKVRSFHFMFVIRTRPVSYTHLTFYYIQSRSQIQVVSVS